MSKFSPSSDGAKNIELYPYKYINAWSKFDKERLPLKDAFYGGLTQTDITEDVSVATGNNSQLNRVRDLKSRLWQCDSQSVPLTMMYRVSDQKSKNVLISDQLVTKVAYRCRRLSHCPHTQ